MHNIPQHPPPPTQVSHLLPLPPRLCSHWPLAGPPRLELFFQARPLVPRVGSVSPFSMSPRGLPCSPSRCRGAPPPRRRPELGSPLSCGACLLLTDFVCPLPPAHPRLLQNQPLGDRGLCLFGRLTPGGPEQIFVRCPHRLQRQPRTRTGAQSSEGPKEPLPVSQP